MCCRAPSSNFVNRLLGANFAAMQRDSEATLKTFLQVEQGPIAQVSGPRLFCPAADQSRHKCMLPTRIQVFCPAIKLSQ